MKRNIITVLLIILLAIIVVVTGGLLKKNRNSHKNVGTSATSSDSVKDIDEVDGEEQLENEEKMWEEHKKLAEEGSLRQQYEPFDWQDWQYTVGDMRVYKNYYIFQNSEDYDGIQLEEPFYACGRENYVYVVTDIKIKNISKYKREYNYTNIQMFCLGDDGRRKCMTGNPGDENWMFNDASDLSRPVNGAKTNPNNWKNGCMDIAPGEEITISMIHRVTVGETVVPPEEGEIRQYTYINPYDKFDHLNIYISFLGTMSDPNCSIENEFYDVENDKYSVIVKCNPVSITME